MPRRLAIIVLSLVAACSTGSRPSTEPTSEPASERADRVLKDDGPVPDFSPNVLVARTVNVASVTTSLKLRAPSRHGGLIDYWIDSAVDFTSGRSSGDYISGGYRWWRAGDAAWIQEGPTDQPIEQVDATSADFAAPPANRLTTFAPLSLLFLAEHVRGSRVTADTVRYELVLPKTARPAWSALFFISNELAADALRPNDEPTRGVGLVEVVDGRVARMEVLFKSTTGEPSEASEFFLSDFDRTVPASLPASASYTPVAV